MPVTRVYCSFFCTPSGPPICIQKAALLSSVLKGSSHAYPQKVLDQLAAHINNPVLLVADIMGRQNATTQDDHKSGTIRAIAATACAS